MTDPILNGMMTAAVLKEVRTPLSIEQVPIPQPTDGQILVQVIACGVCHSDLHAVDGDWDPGPTLPLIPGHEVVGRVVALGVGVDRLHIGDMVGVPWLFSACGQCELCLEGMETVCLAAKATGYGESGGYGEFMVADANFVAVLPPGCNPVQIAPILCAGVTTYRGLKRSGARPGQWVAIVGVGGLGHLAVQYATAMGLRVVAVDISTEKLDLARSLGAEVVINAALSDPVAAVRQATGGVHAAVVAAVATAAFEQSVGMLRPAGTAVYLGMPGGVGDEMRMSIAALIGGELSVRGSSIGTRFDLQEAIDFALRGLVTTSVRAIRLEQINQVLDEMRAGGIVGRVVVSFTQET